MSSEGFTTATQPHLTTEATSTQQRAAAAKAQASNAAAGVLNHPIVASARDSMNGQLSYLDKELGKNKYAREFEAKTQVPKTYGFLGLAFVFFISIFFNIFGLAPAVTTILGFAYPAYLSMQALESPGASDDKQWLTYWTVFAGLTTLESIALPLLVRYIPWYFCLKSVGIVALQRPNGAIPLYDNVLRPAFFKNKKANVPVAQPATSYTVPVSDHEKVL